jgi:hypothetical protein
MMLSPHIACGILAVVLVTAAGCSTFHRPQQVAFHVVDAVKGEPIAGAVVSAGAYNIAPDVVVGKTDTKGDFRCSTDAFGMELGGCTVTFSPIRVWIASRGFAPELIELSTGDSPKDALVVRLKPGRVVRGRVLTEAGSPMGNEPVLLVGNADKWPIQFATVTDVDGRFRWDEAPKGDIYIVPGVHLLASDGALAGSKRRQKDGEQCVCQRLAVSDDETIVRARGIRQNVAGKATGRIFYAVSRDGRPVVPGILFECLERTSFQMASQVMPGSASPDLTPRCIIVVSDDKTTVQFFRIDDKGNVQYAYEFSQLADNEGKQEKERKEKAGDSEKIGTNWEHRH